jgi:uncharacterized membrane protein YtjA (UPF0391 family)
LSLPEKSNIAAYSFHCYFLILADVALILGAKGVAGLSMTIANWLVIIFVVLAIISFLLLHGGGCRWEIRSRPL